MHCLFASDTKKSRKKESYSAYEKIRFHSEGRMNHFGKQARKRFLLTIFVALIFLFWVQALKNNQLQKITEKIVALFDTFCEIIQHA